MPRKSSSNQRIRQAAAIKARLALAGLTLADIDRDYRLSPGTARNTLRTRQASGRSPLLSPPGRSFSGRTGTTGAVSGDRPRTIPVLRPSGNAEKS